LVEELFHQALSLPADRRARFLDERVSDRPEVRSRVARLLQLDDSAGEFLGRPAVIGANELAAMAPPVEGVRPAEIGRRPEACSAASGPWAPAVDRSTLTGRKVGGYELLRLIGSGGMGAVYEARQQRPGRIVALKLMNPSLGSDRAVRRFEYEIEVLARLVHPGIATVYAAGVADDGVLRIPYFAMELVPQAHTLTQYAQMHGLAIRRRLHLFLKACDAVHHAHSHGVIHRDLKPANILVRGDAAHAAAADELPQPKVIDYGLARLLNADESLVASATRPGDVVGTPAYMAPEQARGDLAGIDSRTDVYALGVILFELLTGRLPFAESDSVRAYLDRILHDEPVRPSSLNRDVDDELDTIILKALRKEPGERYSSVDQLAGDIRRYLAGEAVEAKRDSKGYVLRKTLARHRVALTVLGGFVLMLVAGLIVSLTLWGRAERERGRTNAALANESAARTQAEQNEQKALREARKAANSFDFLREVLTQSDLMVKGEHDTRILRLILDKAGERVTSGLSDEPEVQAHAYLSIAQAYQAIAAFDEARVWTDRALLLRRKLQPPDDSGTFDLTVVRDVIDAEQGSFTASAAILRERYAHALAVFGPEHPSTLLVRLFYAGAELLAGDYAEGAQVLDGYTETCDRVLGRQDYCCINAWSILSALHVYEGRLDAALEAAQVGLERARGEHGGTVGAELAALGCVAEAHLRAGRLDEAERLYQEAWDRGREKLGEEAPATLDYEVSLGEVMLLQGKLAEAEGHIQRGVEARVRALGRGHPFTARTQALLGELRRRQGRPEEAVELLREALATLRQQLADSNVLVAEAVRMLADALADQGRFAEAEQELLACLRAADGDEAVESRLRCRTAEEIRSLHARWEETETPRSGLESGELEAALADCPPTDPTTDRS